VAGIVVFADPFGPAQAAGGAAIIGGIALSMLPLLRPARQPRTEPAATPAVPRAARAGPQPAPSVLRVTPSDLRAALAAPAVPGRAPARRVPARAVPRRPPSFPGAAPLRARYRHAADLHPADRDPRRRPAGRRVRGRPGVLLVVERQDREPLSVGGL
jgi:hypothetical protein